MVGQFEDMNLTVRPLLILIAGPYRSNTGDDPAKIAPGTCGCGVADTDTDIDGVAN